MVSLIQQNPDLRNNPENSLMNTEGQFSTCSVTTRSVFLEHFAHSLCNSFGWTLLTFHHSEMMI